MDIHARGDAVPPAPNADNEAPDPVMLEHRRTDLIMLQA
jgi:hypothetical protein